MSRRTWGTLQVPPNRKVRTDPKRWETREAERRRKEHQQEIAFLKFVVAHPGSHSELVYRALGIHVTEGSATRDMLIENGLIRMQQKSAKIKWGMPIEITQKGLNYLQNLSATP